MLVVLLVTSLVFLSLASYADSRSKYEPVDLVGVKFEDLPDSSDSLREDKTKNDAPSLVNTMAWFVAGLLMMAFIYIWKVVIKPLSKKSILWIKSLQKEKIIKGLTAGTAILMLLFPPWIESINGLSRPLGYGLLFLPPEASYHRNASVSLDYGRLILQFIMLGGLTWIGMKLNEKNKIN